MADQVKAVELPVVLLLELADKIIDSVVKLFAVGRIS